MAGWGWFMSSEHKKYKQVKEAIKAAILEGKIAPHQKISSENELVREFQVSRHTVRQAIGELVSEGWLYRQQGRGTFCADRGKQNASRDNKTIAIITTYISDYIFPSIIRGAESYLSSKGYSVLLASTDNQIEQEARCLQNILSKQIEGMIVEPTKSAISNPNLSYYLNMELNRIPYVMINAYYPELSPLSITVNDELGGYLATEHLIQLGHRRIVGIFKRDDLQGVHRMKGFIRAHRAFQVPIQPGMIISFDTEEKFSKPKKVIRQMLSSKSGRPTAIFCYNDEIAVQLFDVIRDLNLKVPEDISIVGFDDSHLAEATEIKLTTVKHPKITMGEDAAKLILEMIESKKTMSDMESIVYTPELVVRKSTASVKH
jgi:GntR family transcriptional regulator, arabinose operon transcriptional repressor